jgi:hypothetical protein
MFPAGYSRVIPTRPAHGLLSHAKYFTKMAKICVSVSSEVSTAAIM